MTSTDVTRPEPGWYPDPGAPGSFRLWDGLEWTAHTRTSITTPVPSSRPGRRVGLRLGGAAIAVAVAGGAIALWLWGSAGGHVSAGATSKAVDCSLARKRPSPATVVGWLARNGTPEVSAPAAQPPSRIPAGGCQAVSFKDSRWGLSNLLISYPSSAAAATAAQHPIGHRVMVPVGIYVVGLDSNLAPWATRYASEVASFVVLEYAWTGSPPTTLP